METHLIPRVSMRRADDSGGGTSWARISRSPAGKIVRDYVHVQTLRKLIFALSKTSRGRLARRLAWQPAEYSILEAIGAEERVTGKKIPSKLRECRPCNPAVLVASR